MVGEEPSCREQISLHILHNSFNAHDLIVSYSEEGKGIYFRLVEGSSIEMLPDGEVLKGSVMIGKRCIFELVSVCNGMFIICALNCILGLEHPTGQKHFLTYIEKELLTMHRVIHTPLTSQLKKILSRNKKPKVQSSAIEHSEE